MEVLGDNIISSRKLLDVDKSVSKKNHILIPQFQMELNEWCDSLRQENIPENDIRIFIDELKNDMIILKKVYRLSEHDSLQVIPKLTPQMQSFIKEQGVSPGFVWSLLVDSEKLHVDFLKTHKTNSGISGVYGPFSFENEVGYLKGMLNGLDRVLETINKPLTPEMYVSFHDTCIDGVIRKKNTGVIKSKPKPFEKGLVTSYWDYGLVLTDGSRKISNEAWRELLDEKILYFKRPLNKEEPIPGMPNEFINKLEPSSKKWDYLAIYNHGRVGPSFNHWHDERIDQRLSRKRLNLLCSRYYFEDLCIRSLEKDPSMSYDKIISEYLNENNQAGNSEKILLVKNDSVNIYKRVEKSNEYKKPAKDQIIENIARLCRALEMSHVLPDGNGRTVYNLTLNKLLLDNKLSPVILSDCYAFDGYYSSGEMAKIIKDGMVNYEIFKNSWNTQDIKNHSKPIIKTEGESHIHHVPTKKAIKNNHRDPLAKNNIEYSQVSSNSIARNFDFVKCLSFLWGCRWPSADKHKNGT